MNDFQRDIKGLKGVLKTRNYYKADSTFKERTLTIMSGAGCNPEMAWGRKIEVKLPGGTTETISSYDLEYVIDEDGKKIFHSDSPIYRTAGQE